MVMLFQTDQACNTDGMRGAVRGRALELRPLERLQRHLRRGTSAASRRLRRRRRQKSFGREVRRARGRDVTRMRH